MGFVEGAIASLKYNHAQIRRSSNFTKVNSDIWKRKRKQSRYKNNPANHKNYELTIAYKAYAFKRDIRNASLVIIVVALTVWLSYWFLIG